MHDASHDLVLSNLRLIGSTADAPVDVFVRGGQVSAIAPTGTSSPDAERLDFDGRFVMSGLWDHHVHFDQWALGRGRMDLAGTESAASVVALVAERLRTDPPAPGTPLIGYGFRDGLWSDAPHKDPLDAIAAEVPIALASQDLHCVWLNSAGLALVGAAGHPTGLLREDEAAPVLRTLQVASASTVDALVDDAARAAAARGIVGVVELENSRATEVWKRRHDAGTDFIRVDCAVYPENLDWAIAQGLRTGDAVDGTRGLIRMGPLKVLTDGSLNTRTAYCHDPYPGLERSPESHGILVVPPETLVSLMRRAHDHGLESTIHAIGDHANGLVLDAFEAVGCPGSIEHAQLLSPEDFPRFAQLGVAASIQPQHAVDDRDVADRHWPGRTDRAFAFGALLAAGATLRLGSDAPVAPLDPWVSIQAAVLRTDDDRPAWHAEQEIPVAAALEASTRGRPYVRAGAPADLVITDVDPLDSPREELHGMPVHATMTDGRWSWLHDSSLVRS